MEIRISPSTVRAQIGRGGADDGPTAGRVGNRQLERVLRSQLQEHLNRRLGRVEVADFYVLEASGQREHAVHGCRVSYDDQPAGGAPGADGGVHDRMDAGAVDELDLAQVEHHQKRPRVKLSQHRLQPRRGRDVELTGHVHPGCIEAAVRARADERAG